MVKKIILGIILLFSIILVGISSFLYFNKDFIQNQTIAALNTQLNARVEVKGNIELSFISTLPNINLQLHNVYIEDKLRISDSLANVKTIALVLNPWSILQKDYTIEGIHVQNGFVHLYTDEKGFNNYEIIKTTSDTTAQKNILQLSEIILENVTIEFEDVKNNFSNKLHTSSSTISGLFTEQNFELKIKTDLYNEELFINNASVLAKKKINGNLKINYTGENSCLAFKNNEIYIEGNVFNINGEICTKTETVNLIANAEGKQLKNILSLIPKDWFEVPEIKGDGNYKINAAINGNFNAPKINLDFDLSNGNVFIKEQDLHLTQVLAKGNYNNLNNKNGSVVLENFSFTTSNSNFNGSLQIDDLEKINIKSQINALINYDFISKFIPKDYLIENGYISIDNMLLDLDYNDKTAVWKLNKVEGALELNEIEGQLVNLAMPYYISGELNGKDNYLSALDLNLSLGKNHLLFDGELKNLIEIILNQNNDKVIDLGIIGSLQSSYFNLNDFIKNSSENNNEVKEITFPPIDGNLNVDFKHFIYQDLEIKNLEVKAKADQTTYHFKILNAATLGGNLKGDLLTNVYNNNFEINLDCNIKSIDVSNMFKAFNNFDQENLHSDNIKGQLSAHLKLSATWLNFTTLDTKNFVMQSDLHLKDGELIDFSPLLSLSGKLKVEQLEHLYFTDLSTNVFIENETITIPQTDIKSNLISLKAGGTQTFDNEIDYKIQLNLKNILAAKFKSKKTVNPEYVNEVEGGINLYISMTGTVDNPIISYDKTSVKEKIKQDFKEEKSEFKNLFKKNEKNEFEKQEREFEKLDEEDKFLDWED